MHLLSKAQGTRPSEFLAIDDDPLAAFCFDRAVFMFGSSLQGELNSIEARNDAEKQNKVDAILRRWLPDSTVAKKFADPASKVKKRSQG